MSQHVLNTRLPAGSLEQEAGDGQGWRAGISGAGASLANAMSRRSSAAAEAAKERLSADSGLCQLGELYKAESQGLVRLVTRRIGNPDDSRDVVQDVFVRLARLGDWTGKIERPQAYARRIAANIVRDRAKRAVRRSASLHLVADEEMLAGPDPVDQLESRDLLRRLEGAMLRLRPKTREIFMAHRVEGLTYAEIAQRTGLSVKGVEKQMSKALQQLDRLVGGA
jgi:RNA polymerase sigma factor (sigma-70 family)